MPLNVEFKARTTRLAELESVLQSFNPRFEGEDNQCDTYFHVPHGRLKLREGTIENALIHYHRNDVAGAKISEVILYQHQPGTTLKQALTAALGVKTVVQKSRRIFFVDNVKFHFDTVSGLGTFIEVEAIDTDGSIGQDQLKEQCLFYASLFSIGAQDYVAASYSDLLLHP